MASAALPQRLRRGIWYAVLPFHLVLCSKIFLNDAVLEITPVTGSSMSPTLSPQYKTTGQRDHLLWSKWQPTSALHRGDVIFFSLPHRPESDGVKRVVALAGDTVLLDPRRRPRDDSGGRWSAEGMHWDMWHGRVTVPPGQVWVEGDNWRQSWDSNSYGPVSTALVKGRAWCLVWPWGSVGGRPWEGWKGRTGVVEAHVEQRVVRDDDATVRVPR